MTDVTDAGRAMMQDAAQRYGVSYEAVEAMARAVANGGGAMAQFNIPEFGGSGQWMSGGMTMVSDMFNYGLQSTVSNLCAELSNAMQNALFFQSPARIGGGGGAQWWPAELGQPASSGGQNAMRYAYFPDSRRLVVDLGDGSPAIVLDTLDHSIGGFSQQQSGGSDPFQGLSFGSQYGTFPVSSLPRVSPAPASFAPEPTLPNPTDYSQQPPLDQMQLQIQQPYRTDLAPVSAPAPSAPEPAPAASGGGDTWRSDPASVIDAIERLGALRQSGVLTEEEFAAKKAELLARL